MKVVFLGPSLSVERARRLLPRASIRPPAKQGDVFAALDQGATAIVLIDGVFEGVPSVWHHELVAARAAGLPVLGAASMGALRAAELPGVVEPVGEIADRYLSGAWSDDAWVALLHGDAESGFRGLTVPQVNVWATAAAAVKARVLTRLEASAWSTRAEAVFYKLRTRRLLIELAPPRARARVAQWLPTGLVDLKAADAERALLRARALRGVGRARAVRFSSYVRRVRLPARRLTAGAEDGTRRLLLASLAQSAGLTPDPNEVARFRAQLAHAPADQAETWAHALALESMVLQAPQHFVDDGPSRREGAALMTALRATRH